MQGYRKDIDGLRAVAVSTVVAFHAGYSWLKGGYVGVDVFFVISGYLMGAIIIEDVRAGRFSILGFYERRVRRIFPALVCMLLVVSLPAYLYLLPNEFDEFGKSLVAATLSASNLFFDQATGYFARSAPSAPLLHTWSLGVEEQFYFLLPLTILVAHRLLPRRLWPILVAIALLSFAWSTHRINTDPVSAFYTLQSRAWELLLGTLISFKPLSFPRAWPAIWAEIASAAGLVLILLPVLIFNRWTPFPGPAALPACVGAGLIIFVGKNRQTLAGRLLSWAPFVFIGQISYSLYLWHWPVLVFVRLSDLFPLGSQAKLVTPLAIAASVVLATLSWRFVEAPFRQGPLRPARRRLFEVAAAAAVLLVTVGLGTVAAGGLPGRYSPAARAMAAYLKEPTKAFMRTGSCFLLPQERWSDFDVEGCLHPESGRKNYLLLGDSHAAHLWYGLKTVFPKRNFLQATIAGCRPVYEGRADAQCNALLHYVLDDFLKHNQVDGLILAGSWNGNDLPALRRMLDWAVGHGQRTILVGPIVQYDDELPRLLAFSAEAQRRHLADEHRRDLSWLDSEMQGIAERRGVRYISLYRLLCQGSSCVTLAAPGVPLQSDDAHLTMAGSVLVATRLRELGLFGENSLLRAKAQ